MTAQGPVMIMAGGTGGHVFPGLAVARRLIDEGVPVVWLGTQKGLEARVVPEAGIPVEWLQVAGLRGNGLLGWVMAPLRIARAVLQAMRVLRRVRPRCVLGLGGYVSGPGGFAAWAMRCPLVIHEQNAIAGLTNRLLSRVASRVLCAFPGAFAACPEAIVVGNPVRDEILALADNLQSGRQDGMPLQVLVVGGSLGAQILNEVVPASLALLPTNERPVVRHQAGSRTLSVAEAAYRQHGVSAEITAFIDDMAAAYAWADLVVCRAGALTISELAAVGRPAVLVPLPHAVDDHQTANARVLADAGAAWLLPQSTLTAEGLAEVLADVTHRPELLADMAARSRTVARHDAAGQVAKACLEVA
ncbi:UDP-N-acetylglucosamine--N-acetylmuramyl-(pentapeptide) pyrophosphoryl-undecaprenol N-acetylglucosamine transferase [Natronocella acetinitrilica]|uniref:UDP-N-acetylglucosamine--N-acetylmuramyl-(pentapeptide) pyrophosphoryl-undecaprenol N-acetylglucosamine transferase n=1 Tax=Natronocella acetinitrilica TaxID=414046 RepID=A0AAE3G151_9GAMM|nr:undecaprenyldiphospho-muramoylpentapeptide beta-N-acetylglucosaminyltransferase [Natronocella acetinitrilica]MCP1673855.1 UDP-N-acetylglucosamine--N-acetylmuramyl-(pentapeptide) pyrophosphoryl-undecaprenol N-acetylglucosamine transferase [Natronocella acetinitrilica]